MKDHYIAVKIFKVKNYAENERKIQKCIKNLLSDYPGFLDYYRFKEFKII